MTMNDLTDMFLDAEEGEVMQSFRAQLDDELITAEDVVMLSDIMK